MCLISDPRNCYGEPPVQETLRQMGTRILTRDRTERRKRVAVSFLERRVEAIAHITPESKYQSLQLRYTGSQRPKIFSRRRPRAKS
jgi:hypothetical protein